jgi:hypothetical protein
MRGPIIVTLVVALAGCAGRNRLGDYDFRNLTLAVEPTLPPYPEVLTGPYFPGHPKDPIHVIVRAGTRIAKEAEARRLRARLDTAAADVDVAGRVADRIGGRAARYLGARLVDRPEAADLILEVEIRDYGIDAEDWDAAARFFVDAEAWLIDGDDRRTIWKTRVREREPITPAILGAHTAVRDVVTAAAFASLSVDDIARALAQLSHFAADRVTDRLRADLREVRD